MDALLILQFGIYCGSPSASKFAPKALHKKLKNSPQNLIVQCVCLLLPARSKLAPWLLVTFVIPCAWSGIPALAAPDTNGWEPGEKKCLEMLEALCCRKFYLLDENINEYHNPLRRVRETFKSWGFEGILKSQQSRARRPTRRFHLRFSGTTEGKDRPVRDPSSVGPGSMPNSREEPDLKAEDRLNAGGARLRGTKLESKQEMLKSTDLGGGISSASRSIKFSSIQSATDRICRGKHNAVDHRLFLACFMKIAILQTL
jgi:hypothetical protein